MMAHTDDRPTVETDVLIIGAGPAGAALASFLGYNGVKGLVISRSSSTVKTPRAHITNLGTMECLRELGLEDEATRLGVPASQVPHTRIGDTMTGPEDFRYLSWGNHPDRRGDYVDASPCQHTDLPQTFSEPLLLKYATQHGFHLRFDTEFLSFTDDADATSGHVTTTLFDKILQQEFRVRSRFLAGADGARSKVVEQLGLPIFDKPGGGMALNVLYEADLSHTVAGAEGLLHLCRAESADEDSVFILGVNRMIRPWHEWLMLLFVKPGVEEVTLDPKIVTKRVQELLGSEAPEINVKHISQWKINEQYASKDISKDNVFCLGDAIHRHPPHNALGSNTCIQDAYNLAWKMAYVLQQRAPRALLASYGVERQPVAKQVVTRANDTSRQVLELQRALGTFEASRAARDAVRSELKAPTPQGRRRRTEIARLRQLTQYEDHALGAEMNQVYEGAGAAVSLANDDGDDDVGVRPEFRRDRDLYYLQSTYPGFRLPHAWLTRDRTRHQVLSTQDVAGRGRFTLLTGLGGKDVWTAAAAQAHKAFPHVPIRCFAIGPGQDYEDVYHAWETKREVDEDGAVLVRPDRVVGWRCVRVDGRRDLGVRLTAAVGAILGYGADVVGSRA